MFVEKFEDKFGFDEIEARQNKEKASEEEVDEEPDWDRAILSALHEVAEIDDGEAEKAIEELNHGLNRMRDFYVEHDAAERFEEDDLAERLRQLRETVRNEFHIDRTLEERLTEAIAAEQYEIAAQLRDEIAKRRPKM